MAGPITHIILALKILALLPSTIDKKEFIVGTSFPDIRYIAHLDRASTHIEPVSFNDVLNESSSFRAGMLFHNIVDIVRMHHFECYFYNRYNLSQYSLPYLKLYPLTLKLAEDTFFYSFHTDWSEIIRYFDSLYDEEKSLCSDEAILYQWHRTLQTYLSNTPNIEALDTFLSQTGGLKLCIDNELFNIHAEYAQLLVSNFFKSTLKNFYLSFESLLEEQIWQTPAEVF